MPTYTEKQLQFSFPETLCWDELDRQGVVIPTGMALVDLVIEREDDLLLVEIKDPSHSNTPQRERESYFRRLQDNSEIKQKLTPKARDSYTFLHLMMRDDKPMKYIVLLGLDAFNHHSVRALLSTFQDRLSSSVEKECDSKWRRKHIHSCIVLSIEKWNELFREWPITRIPAE